MTSRSDRLFTPPFFLMCGFTFTVFLSAFQLLPAAPFRILDLGGSHALAGLFLGFLTYSSASTAPFTGALADRLGRRRTLVGTSLVLALFSIGYALSSNAVVPLALALMHGLFWSALLAASAAYMTGLIPEARRAEGISYWGMATVVAVAVAPSVGLAVYQRLGWAWLCGGTAVLHLSMAVIAYRLPEIDRERPHTASLLPRPLVEWRILALSLTLFLYSFGYGAINSFVALYAIQEGVAPPGLYFIVFALMTLAVRPFSGRLADRAGYRAVYLPCLVLISIGLALLAVSGARPWVVASAIVFGLGFGAAYPIYVAYVMQHVAEARRGAAFGAILTAFDTGIGTGSIVSGLVVERFGYSPAFGLAALLSVLALPYFLWAERHLLGRRQSSIIASA
jgi:MFS family permease